MSILEEKRGFFCLKIRLDLPHEMLKQIARSVKMNIFATASLRKKPISFDYSLRWCFVAIKRDWMANPYNPWTVLL